MSKYTLAYVNGERFNISFRRISVFSICLYIIVSTIFESSEVLPSYFASLTLYLCLGCCMLNAFFTYNRIRINWLLVSLLVFGLVLSLSCLYTPASSAIYNSRIYRYFTSLILVFFAYNTIKDERDIHSIIWAFVLGGLGLSISVYSFYGLSYLINAGERLSNGDFGNVNSLGLSCGLSVVLAVYLMVTKKRHFLILALTILINMPVIMFTGSRKAILSVVISLSVFLFLYKRDKNFILRLFTIVALVGGIVLLINIVPAFEPIKQRFDGLFVTTEQAEMDLENLEGAQKRMYYIQEGLRIFKENIWFGRGFCASYYIFGAYTHNNYVELLMCNGLVGFVAYYFMYLKMIIGNFKIRNKDSASFSLIYMLFARTIFVEFMLVNHYSRMTMLMLVVMQSVIEISCRKDEKSVVTEII